MNILEARRRLLEGVVKKRTAEGNPIVVRSLARMYPGLNIYGWSKQNGTPSPENPVPIESAGDSGQIAVTVQGGNLVNIPDIPAGDGKLNIKIPADISASFVVSVDDSDVVIEGVAVWRLKFDFEDGSSLYAVDKNFPMTFKANPENKVVAITYRDIRMASGTYRNFMINYGSTPLPYEPYRTTQTVTLISERPLTKWDKMEKRNGQWGWVYKSNEVVFDGSEAEAWTLYNNGFYILGGLKDITLDTTLHAGSLSDKFHYSRTGDYAYFRVTDTGSSYSPIFYYSGIADVESWKKFLAENNVSYLYPTEAETFVPLTESEQEQMNALHTFRPTTVLSNDEGCNMALTYKTKKPLEVTT